MIEKKEYIRAIGMIDALKNTHGEGALLNESVTQYYRGFLVPLFEASGENIRGFKSLKTYDKIRKFLQDRMVATFGSTVTEAPSFKKDDEWGEEGVDWEWEYYEDL